ncbi:hypothetical protein DPMN_056697 [Dreissena polymorpha]|uniref:Uncharacterized protein n=1 Tax=Dreissena polymorpha TaxID=45954 RepID=A0A9D4HTV0_DREPO|nr:hypothetical protein DPMN_056697 [Dreissena polymorpha]
MDRSKPVVIVRGIAQPLNTLYVFSARDSSTAYQPLINRYQPLINHCAMDRSPTVVIVHQPVSNHLTTSDQSLINNCCHSINPWCHIVLDASTTDQLLINRWCFYLRGIHQPLEVADRMLEGGFAATVVDSGVMAVLPVQLVVRDKQPKRQHDLPDKKQSRFYSFKRSTAAKQLIDGVAVADDNRQNFVINNTYNLRDLSR